jgi:hypothetical protein
MAVEQRLLLSTFTVTRADDNGGAGTLRWAVERANATTGSNKIDFDPTIFKTDFLISLQAGQLALTNTTGTQSITGPTNHVVIYANHESRVFEIGSGVTASLSGLTIRGGGRVDAGAGVRLAPGSAATLTNCELSGNDAFQQGGAIDSAGGTLALINTTVVNNRATFFGGGVSSSGKLTISRSTLENNNAQKGGGVFLDRNSQGMIVSSLLTFNSAQLGGAVLSIGDLELASVRVDQNSSTGWGGGLDNEGKMKVVESSISDNKASLLGGGINNERVLSIVASTIDGNHATNGAGLRNDGTLTLVNSTVAQNLAADWGGGVTNDGFGTATMINVTISANSAGKGSGGLDNFHTAVLTNTIVAGNTQGSTPSDIGGDTHVTGSHNLVGTGGDGGLKNGVNGNQVGVADPGLEHLGDYGGPTQTMALVFDSPAIDAGETGADIPAVDQRGLPRVGIPDIGAFESLGAASKFAVSPALTDAGARVASLLTPTKRSWYAVEPIAQRTMTRSAPLSRTHAARLPVRIVAIGTDRPASGRGVAHAFARPSSEGTAVRDIDVIG